MLTDEQIVAATPGTKPFRLWDSGGLYVEVAPKGGKYWRLKYRYGGKEKRLSLGVFPNVSIGEARQQRAELRALIAQGIDPSAKRKSEYEARLAANAAASIPRFAVDNNGALSVHLGNRRLFLSPDETGELRAFLDATRAVPIKASPCP
ncbi:MAG TPA: Arm DNA-binding domain-containing protein [Casimicrobiaceae bacterium]|nr:Arm DNA-binding domain-containing protein [Casimicrobiaceae bacterium]